MPTASNIAGNDLGYAQLTNFAGAPVSINSITFDGQPTPGAPVGTEILMVRAEVTAARFRTDGVAPTTTVGYIVPPRLTDIIINVAQFPQAQFIGTTAGTILNIIAIGQTPP